MDDSRIPGWTLTRHVVSWTLAVFVAALLAALLGAWLLTMKVTVSGAGVLEPTAVWAVRPNESGIVSSILVRGGDTVRAGQVIALLDSSSARGELLEAQSQLRTARIELARLEQSAPIDSDRARAVMAAAAARVIRARTALRQRMADFSIEGNPDSIAADLGARLHIGLDMPSADLLAAKSELEISRALVASTELAPFAIATKRSDIQRLEARVSMGRAKLHRYVIRAPADGLVISDQTEQLEGSLISAGQALLDIADVRRWRATLNVSERNVYRIRVGDPVDIEITAFSATTADRVRGRVESVGWQASGDNLSASQENAGSAGYRVLVAIDSNSVPQMMSGGLRRGFAVRGEIVTRSERALTLIFEHFVDRSRRLSR